MPASLLSQIPNLTPDEVLEFLPYWKKHVRLKRNDFLIRPGETESGLYLVLDGTLRIYYPAGDEEIVVGFAYPQTLICSFPSFVNNLPSEYAIQALKKCELVGISKKDFNTFLLSHPNFERYWRQELEKVVLGRIDREIDLLLPEPEQRLERLLQRSPHIFQLVPKKYIASYLRMSPETLSRIS